MYLYVESIKIDKIMVIITSKTVLPGQYGTKRLHEKYGDKLLAVRYKLDTQRRVKQSQE